MQRLLCLCAPACLCGFINIYVCRHIHVHKKSFKPSLDSKNCNHLFSSAKYYKGTSESSKSNRCNVCFQSSIISTRHTCTRFLKELCWLLQMYWETNFFRRAWTSWAPVCFETFVWERPCFYADTLPRVFFCHENVFHSLSLVAVWLFFSQFKVFYTAVSVSVHDWVSRFCGSSAPVRYHLLIRHLTVTIQNSWLCKSVSKRFDHDWRQR